VQPSAENSFLVAQGGFFAKLAGGRSPFLFKGRVGDRHRLRRYTRPVRRLWPTRGHAGVTDSAGSPGDENWRGLPVQTRLLRK